jgi:hypothetical protein
VKIGRSAHRHGIADKDIHHAIRNALRIIPQDNVDVIVGPSRTGELLEIGVLDPDGKDPIVIHAMNCRPGFNPYL